MYKFKQTFRLKVLCCAVISIVLLSLCGCNNESTVKYYTVDTVPSFNGSTAYVEIYGNRPSFDKSELTTVSFEKYSDLDELGRCGVAYACIGQDIMPTEERSAIGMIKPAGWHTVKYDCVDGKYLYNRCHLIGYQLSGENANEKNLITGTRYLNMDGMLPFENQVAGYVKETNNHVLYRVTPIYDDDNLLARGIQIEAESVEDNGKDILFNVYVYNAQPGVSINYLNGDSLLGENQTFETVISNNSDESNTVETTYILNTNSKKFHLPDCKSVDTIKPQNKEKTNKRKDELIAEGYEPCKSCNP